MDYLPGELVIYQGDGEWSALYVRGNLEIVGDHYLIDEKLHELLEIDVRESNDFLRGGDHREDVAPTLDDVAAYRNVRDRLDYEAEQLEDQARKLEAQATELRNRKVV